MGFGSYDDDGVSTSQSDHSGEVEYEIDASNDELLDRLKEIKDE